MVDAVIYLDLQQHFAAGFGQTIQIDLKRKESAAMGRGLLSVDENPRTVGDGVKTEKDALPFQESGNGKTRTVPGETGVIAEFRIRALVVVGSGDGDILPGLVLTQPE